MSVRSSGAVTIEGDFARTAPCTDSACLAPSAFTWVRGYPNVLYGINQCYARTSPRPSPRLPLPMRLDSIPRHLIGVTAYSAQTSQITYDVTYDLWLHPPARSGRADPRARSRYWYGPTMTPERSCRPACRSGRPVSPSPSSGLPARAAQAWSIYASNIDRNGRTAPWGGTLWFVPSRADVVGHGRVSVDLSAVLSAAGRLLHDNYGWPELGQHVLARHRVLRPRVRPGERQSDGRGSVALLRADLRLLSRRAKHSAGRRLRVETSSGAPTGRARYRGRPVSVAVPESGPERFSLKDADAQPGEGVPHQTAV